MSLQSELQKCVRHDNTAELNRLLRENNINTIMPLLLDELYSIALFSSVAIFNIVFTIPAVAQHLSENVSARKEFLSTVLGHSNEALVNRVFEIQLFRDEVINDPYAMVLAVAINRNCAPQALAKIQELTSIDEYIARKDNQVWLTANVHCNELAMNCLLQFPEVFAKVYAKDPKQSLELDYINTRFMEYYFANLPQGDLTAKEAKLAYLVLLALIKTYPERAAIRNSVKLIAESEEDASRSNTFIYKTIKIARHWREKYLPDTENVHADRIAALFAIPAVQRLAQANNLPYTANDAPARSLVETAPRPAITC